MRSNADFSPFRRSSVGFDRLFDLMEGKDSPQGDETFPPFDIVQEGEDNYRITMAVAGFGRDDIEIVEQQNQLTVTGRRAKSDDGGRFVHRGIASTPFERKFALGDFVKVSKADLKDGLLSISLAREVPEYMKPHKIEIGGGGAAKK